MSIHINIPSAAVPWVLLTLILATVMAPGLVGLVGVSYIVGCVLVQAWCGE